MVVREEERFRNLLPSFTVSHCRTEMGEHNYLGIFNRAIGIGHFNPFAVVQVAASELINIAVAAISDDFLSGEWNQH